MLGSSGGAVASGITSAAEAVQSACDRTVLAYYQVISSMFKVLISGDIHHRAK